MELKTFIEARCTNNMHTGENVFAVGTFKGLQIVSFQRESVKKTKSSNYCLREANLFFYM